MWRKGTTGHADHGTGDVHPSPHSTVTASASPPLSAAAGRTATHRWPLRTLFPSSTAPSQAALSQQYQLHKKTDTLEDEVDDGDEDEWGEVAPANASLYFSSPTAMTVAAASAAAAGAGAAAATRHVAGGGHSTAQVRALPATGEEGESENATSAPANASQAITHFSDMDHVRQRHGGPVAVPSRRPLGAVRGGGRETLWSGSSSHGALGAPVLAKEENKGEDEAEDEWGETVQPSRLTASLPSHSAPQLRTLPGASTTTQALPLLPLRHSAVLPSTQTQLKNITNDDIFASEDAALAHPHHGTPETTRQHERTAAASIATPTQLTRPTSTATAVSATPAAASAKSASPAPYTPAPAAFHSGIRGLRPSHDSGSAVSSDAITGLGERGKKKKKGLGAVALLSDTPLTSSTRTPLSQHREASSPLDTAHQQAERLRIEAEEAERLRQEAEEAERLRLEAEEAERLRMEAEQAERLRQEAEEAERLRLEAEEAERLRMEAEQAERLRQEAEEAERFRQEAEEAERLRLEAEEAERLRIVAEEAERFRQEAEEAERLRLEAEEAERLRQEAEEGERLRLEAEETERLRIVAEEAERLCLEAEEAERLRQEAEEGERLRLEAEETERLRIVAEEAERLRQEAEEAERLRQEAEEGERLRLEAEETERLRIVAEEAERLCLEAEEAERLRQEAEEGERLRLEAEETERLRIVAEEAERLRQEAEEAERLRIEAEEAERLRLEAEEAERLRIEAEEAERLRQEAEEAERLRLEAEQEERLRQEAEQAERLRQEAEQEERLRLEAEEAERLRLEAEEAERLRIEAEEAERLRIEAEEAERLRLEAEEAERLRLEAEEAAAPPTVADALEGVVALLTKLSAPESSKQVQGSKLGALVRALEDAEKFLARHKPQQARASTDPADCYRELLRCLLHKAQAKQETNATFNNSVAVTGKVHQSIALLCETWSKDADAMPAAWGWAWEAALHRPALTLSPDQPQRRSAMRHLALAVEEVGTCVLVQSPLWTPAERVASALVAHLVQWAQQVIEDEPSRAGEAPAQRGMASFTVATLPPLRSHTEPGQPFTLQDVHACVLAALQEALSASHDVLLPDGEDAGVGIGSWVKPLLDCVALATLLRDEAVKSEATLATWRHASGSAEEAADAEVHAEAALSVAQQQLREGSWVVWYVLRVVGLLSWWDTTQLLLRPPPASLGWAMKL